MVLIIYYGTNNLFTLTLTKSNKIYTFLSY